MDSDSDVPVPSDEEMGDDEDYYYDYSDDNGGSSDGGEGGGVDEESGDEQLDAGEYEGSVEAVSRREQRYIVLNETDISERQEEDISKVCAILLIPREEACVLLHHYKWNISKLNDEWFSDEEKVRDIVGLPINGIEFQNSRKLTCGICFEGYSTSALSSASCVHFYCNECWEGYISASINDGPGCLALRCPEPSCTAMVLEETINRLAKDEDKVKYKKFVLRSYIEDNKKMKWCPAPDCTRAVEFLGDLNYDVSCMCKFNFCWNCTEETHRPVSCETVSKWILKNSSESENMNWLCLGAWSEHGIRTGGGYYACNRFESAKEKGIYDEAEARRERAKNSLVRYMHYYERWASNQTSRQKAQADLQKAASENLAKLSDVFGIPETQLKFIPEAWSQIIECRRVLKWTYAYGYYLDDKAKSEFFVYLQGEAESGLERLHKCAEKDIHAFLPKAGKTEPAPSLEDFSKFRVKLAGLTSVTRNYFENLVRALEAGLEDVHGMGQSTSQSTSNNTTGTSYKKLVTTGKSGRNKAARLS